MNDDSGNRRRRRGAPNTMNMTCMEDIRVGSFNVGRKRGWQTGVQTVLVQGQLDLLLLLDTGQTTSQKGLIGNTIGEVWLEGSRNSSLIVVAEDPRRWKIIQEWTVVENCYIKVTDGFNRIAGVYLRPNQNTRVMTEVMEKLAQWVQVPGLLIADFKGRHRIWDMRTNLRGTRLVQLADKYDLEIMTTDGPTFETRGGRSGGGSSKVDLGIVKGWRQE